MTPNCLNQGGVPTTCALTVNFVAINIAAQAIKSWKNVSDDLIKNSPHVGNVNFRGNQWAKLHFAYIDQIIAMMNRCIHLLLSWSVSKTFVSNMVWQKFNPQVRSPRHCILRHCSHLTWQGYDCTYTARSHRNRRWNQLSERKVMHSQMSVMELALSIMSQKLGDKKTQSRLLN